MITYSFTKKRKFKVKSSLHVSLEFSRYHVKPFGKEPVFQQLIFLINQLSENKKLLDLQKWY